MPIDRDREIRESEKAVLSSIIYHYKDIVTLVDLSLIKSDFFVTPAAKRIFQSIQKTDHSNGEYDPILILNKVKEFCLSDYEFQQCMEYMEGLSKDVKYFSIKKYLFLLGGGKIKRDLNYLANSILKKDLSEDNFSDIIAKWKNRFQDITSQTISTNYLSAEDAIKNFEDFIVSSNQPGKKGFLKTNFVHLDKKIKSLGGGQLVIVASRPGVGKTTFALNLIKKNFKYIQKEDPEAVYIGLFSLEMSTSALLSRLIAMDANLELSVVQRLVDGGALEESENQILQLSKENIKKLSLLFCDEPKITIGKIISTIRTWVREFNLKLVIIDYLQLVNVPLDRNTSNLNQYQKIGIISRDLKILAMELNICIVTLAQLNRKVEERRGADKSPILSDLRESGSIEQDADVVMFLYDYKEEDKDDSEDTDSFNSGDSFSGTPIMLNVAKNRHGPVGKIEFVFDKTYGIFKLAN